MTARLLPFLRALCPPPPPDPAYLAERAAMVLTTSGQPCAKVRAALIRAVADDDMSAAKDALTGWYVETINRRPAHE